MSVKPSSLAIYQAIAACWTWGTWNSSTGVLWTLRSTLTLQSHPGLVEGTETWTLPFNVTMSKHLCTSYPLYISNISTLSSPGFDPLSAFFYQTRRKTVRDDRGKSHTENMLLPLLTDLFHLLLSNGVTPHLWHKVKITPLHKKGPITSPQNYRLLAINGCIYRLFANVVRDLLMDWALAEHQIPDSQFGFCPTRNTNQPLFILRHILATAKKK